LMPIIFGVIGKKVKAEGITSAAGLASLLASQSGFLKNLLPAGLASILGLANLNDLGKKASATAAYVAEKSSGGFARFLPWLLLPLLLFLGWGLFKNMKLPAPSVPEVSAPKIVAPVVEKVSDFFQTTLSSGYAIKGAKNGIEDKLIIFIQDSGKPVDGVLWFSMDGITFDTDKATLRQESSVQVRNIAEILKAFPKVKIKIGGYTDNTGDANANLTLSTNRANTVKNSLVVMGIDASRVDAKGYGSEHPVASNETPEGRQQNRRIDVNVTAK